MAKQLRLSNIKTTRNAISKLCREFYRNDEGLERDTTWWNTMRGLMAELIKAHNVEKNLDIEKRLEAVERAFAEWRKERNG